jgi:hypothetical protein
MDVLIAKMHKLFSLVPIWLAVCSTAFAWEEPDGFLGLKWGTPTAEFREQQPRAVEMTKDGVSSKARVRSFTVRDVSLETVRVNINYVFLEDQFICAYVFFDPKEFSVIERVFTTKYGAPNESKENVISPSIGVEYQNKTLKWEGESILIEITRYYGARPDGFVAIGKKSFLHPPPRPIFLRPPM